MVGDILQYDADTYEEPSVTEILKTFDDEHDTKQMILIGRDGAITNLEIGGDDDADEE